MAAEQSQRTVTIKNAALRAVGPFAAFPTKIIRDADLSIGARLTYAVLLSYAHQDGFCYPAQGSLGTDLGVGERQVRRLLKELREKGFIDWKQQGFNRPNIYFILASEPCQLGRRTGTPKASKENMDGTQVSAPDRTNTSASDWTRESSQERTSVSDYKEAPTKRHKVVNDITANDQKRSSKVRPSVGGTTPTISNAALHTKYKLTNDQIGRVHWLVDKQAELLGAIERNHAYYVNRAAEAVRDGHDNLLDRTLSDFKQAATAIAVRNPPSYFISMWREALAQPTPTAPTSICPSGAVADLFARAVDAPTDDPRARLIAEAECHGVSVPDYIRNADIGAVSRWWATHSGSACSKRS